MDTDSIVRVNINSNQNYVNLIKNMYMFLFVFLIWHLLLSLSYDKKQPLNIGLTGGLLNTNFVNFLLTGMISILSFYLIFQKILEFN